MPAIPAPIRTWSSRMNVPFGTENTTSNALLTQFAAWSLKQHLIDAHTTGTLHGTRAANSVWTVVGSSDGATAGLDGVDRWTTTFTASKIVRASQGSAHSWIVLRNVTSGLWVCIDMNNTNSGTLSITCSQSAPTGGSTTTRPTMSGEWMAGLQRGTNSDVNASASSQIVSESTLNTLYYTHFSCAEDGTFHFEVSRAGSGRMNVFLALWRTTGADASDTRNWYWIHDNQTTPRGAPHHGPSAGINFDAGTTTRLPSGSTASSGGIRYVSFGGISDTHIYSGNSTLDFLTGQYYAEPLEVRELSPQVVDRGYFADIVFIGGVAVGSTYPSINQTHFCAGACLLPCGPGAVPII